MKKSNFILVGIAIICIVMTHSVDRMVYSNENSDLQNSNKKLSKKYDQSIAALKDHSKMLEDCEIKKLVQYNELQKRIDSLLNLKD